jgi:hypothetical protein
MGHEPLHQPAVDEDEAEENNDDPEHVVAPTVGISQ